MIAAEIICITQTGLWFVLLIRAAGPRKTDGGHLAAISREKKDRRKRTHTQKPKVNHV
jgi:hypothetical protein